MIEMPVTTQVLGSPNPTNIINEEFPSRIKPVKKRGRKRKTRRKSVKGKTKAQLKKKPNTMKEISSSLRSECFRLAAFIKQSSFRKGSVF